MTRQKGTKKRPKGLPLWEPLYGKGLCGPYPQWRQAAVTVVPTGHVPPANAAKQVGRKYVWRHLPLRGSRGQHFTVFQYQPPGRQPFGLKVKSPRACGPAPLPEGGPHPTQGGRVSPDSAANSGRAGLTPPSLAQRRRERQSYQGASGGPDSAANRAAGRADTPAGWLSPCTGARGAPRPLFVTFSRQRK